MGILGVSGTLIGCRLDLLLEGFYIHNEISRAMKSFVLS